MEWPCVKNERQIYKKKITIKKQIHPVL